MPHKRLLPVLLLPFLLSACSAHSHNEALRQATAQLGWPRGSISVMKMDVPASESIPCTFYTLTTNDRTDAGLFAFAEDSQGRLVGTAADAGHAGLARVLAQCLAASDNAQPWAEVVATYISAGWLNVIDDNDKLAQQMMKGQGHDWHPPVLGQTATGKTIEFWAQHGFSRKFVRVRATLAPDGRLQVEETAMPH